MRQVRNYEGQTPSSTSCRVAAAAQPRLAAGLAGLLGNLGELGLTSDDTVLVFLTEGPTDSANYRRVVGGNQE